MHPLKFALSAKRFIASIFRESQPAISTSSIIARPEHNVSRADISRNAVKVLYRLREAGFASYLVGGGVRDLLLGREPKDFDIATDAHPEDVRKLFRNCRLIGRRFRLAHVHFGREIIEVATFRAHHDEGEDGAGESMDGRILRDNVYGTIEQDAARRDFTVNALYYNIQDFSVVDFSTGIEDLRAGVLRLIGEPEVRLREDPVRMLRMVRFVAKLGFRVDPAIEEKIPALAPLLAQMPPARLYEEILKMFHGGYALQSFELLRHYDMFGQLFPASEACLAEEEAGFPRLLIARAMENTDRRVAEGKPVTPAFLFAAILWQPMLRRREFYRGRGLPEVECQQLAADDVVREQSQTVAVPRRFSQVTREIWSMQARLERNTGRRPLRLLEHPRFRAGYDFLVLRAESGEEVQPLAQWWTEFQENAGDGRAQMLSPEPRRRRGRRRRRKSATD